MDLKKRKTVSLINLGLNHCWSLVKRPERCYLESSLQLPALVHWLKVKSHDKSGWRVHRGKHTTKQMRNASTQITMYAMPSSLNPTHFSMHSSCKLRWVLNVQFAPWPKQQSHCCTTSYANAKHIWISSHSRKWLMSHRDLLCMEMPMYQLVSMPAM